MRLQPLRFTKPLPLPNTPPPFLFLCFCHSFIYPLFFLPLSHSHLCPLSASAVASFCVVFFFSFCCHALYLERAEHYSASVKRKKKRKKSFSRHSHLWMNEPQASSHGKRTFSRAERFKLCCTDFVFGAKMRKPAVTCHSHAAVARSNVKNNTWHLISLLVALEKCNKKNFKYAPCLRLF